MSENPRSPCEHCNARGMFAGKPCIKCGGNGYFLTIPADEDEPVKLRLDRPMRRRPEAS